MTSRRDEIDAAVAAYNATGRKPPLKAVDARQLLTIMFADADVCCRNLDSLWAEGFSAGLLVQLLHNLIETGLVSKERGKGSAPNIYRLHLPPQAQQ